MHIERPIEPYRSNFFILIEGWIMGASANDYIKRTFDTALSNPEVKAFLEMPENRDLFERGKHAVKLLHDSRQNNLLFEKFKKRVRDKDGQIELHNELARLNNTAFSVLNPLLVELDDRMQKAGIDTNRFNF